MLEKLIKYANLAVKVAGEEESVRIQAILSAYSQEIALKERLVNRVKPGETMTRQEFMAICSTWLLNPYMESPPILYAWECLDG